MSYTYPTGFPQGTACLFTNKLREVLIAEIIAINGYQAHIANSDMPDVNEAWHSIMEDEKKHYGWILSLLRRYDPVEYQMHLVNQARRAGPKSPMQAFTPQYDRQIILNNLREDIKGELEAVILYEEELPLLPYPDIRDTLQAVIDEEKSHTEYLTEIVLKYDPDLYDGLD